MNIWLIALSLSLRFYLQLVAAAAAKIMPFKPSFPYWESVLQTQAPVWLWFWGNFDGVHYLNIAKVGYEYGLTQAFFPLYPLLIRFFTYFWSNSLITALIISHLAFAGFIFFFIKLGRLDFPSGTVKWAAILLLLFPTSFYFFGVYTESLFLMLAAGCLYFSRRKVWAAAVMMAGLATATRLVGLFLVPAILWEYWQAKNKKINLLTVMAMGLTSISGLVAYLFYLDQKFNNFMIFIDSQPGFGAGRQVNKLILPYQVIGRYIKMLITVDKNNEIYWVLVLELSAGLAAIGLLVWALYKKLRLSYLAFILPALLLPTLTGTFASMPRYLLAGFPLFYLLGNIKGQRIKIILSVVFIMVLTWSFSRFSRGYWLS